MKLTAEEIAALVAEKEAELAREALRLAYEKSLKRLVRKADKDGFKIGKKLLSHMERKEENCWEIR